MKILQSLHDWLFPKPHVWKETKRENLGSHLYFGTCPQDISTIYRIAIHETCLLTGDTRIREITDMHPVREQPPL